MPSETAIESFIGSCFRSVWALELVQFLLANEGKSFAREDLVAALRASDAVVSQSVATLLTVGLVTEEENRICLRSGDSDNRDLLKAAVELYRRRPDRVRRLIIAATSPGLTAFSDAFRLRKD